MRNGRIVLSAVCMIMAASGARAEFMLGTSSGEKFYNGDAASNVTSFTGTVGGQHSGDPVTVTTNVGVDTGAGFSTIKPASNGSNLTTVTFTPSDPNLFDGFAFGGLLNSSANGTVIVTVQDNQGDAPQTFTISGLGNGDIGSIGIIAVPNSGETIKSVTLTSSWKQEKQNYFTYAPTHPVPEPSSALMLGLGGLGLASFMKRRQKQRAANV